MRILPIILLLAGCGSTSYEVSHRTSPKRPLVEELQQQILALQAELATIAKSDYADCDGVLSDAAKNICKIAQAATIEVRVEMRGAISDLAAQLESKIEDSAKDFTQMAAAWKQIYGTDFPSTTSPGTPTLSDCQNNTGNASILGCISKFSSDIQTIQSQIAVLNTTASGTMTTVEVGSENVSAGPLYEQLIRLADQSRINAYSDGLGTVFTIGSNPINASNGSSTVTITITAHGLSNGERVQIEDCASGRGFTWQHLNGRFAVSGVTANTFNITLAGVATSGGIFGGANCVVRKSSGAGMSTIWTSVNLSDSAVRTTTGGSRAYNFAICKTGSQGKVCYDSTNNSATFITISTGWAGCAGSGNIICK